jgi:hypothetical protein
MIEFNFKRYIAKKKKKNSKKFKKLYLNMNSKRTNLNENLNRLTLKDF